MSKNHNKTVKQEPIEDETKFEYESRIVAFIDILGFSDLVQETAQSQDKLCNMLSTLQLLNTHQNTDLVNMLMGDHEKGTPLIQYTCFSDSITASCQTFDADDNSINFYFMMDSLLRLGHNLAMQGIFVRGGISTGPFIHTPTGIVIGPPLVEAYQIESKVSKNARIVLSDKLIALIKNDYQTNALGKVLQRYEDGCIGFDQMVFSDYITNACLKYAVSINKSVFEDMEKIRSHIIASFDKCTTNPNVYEKYKWIRERFNATASKHQGSIDPICDEDHLVETKCLTFEEVDKLENTGEYR